PGCASAAAGNHNASTQPNAAAACSSNRLQTTCIALAPGHGPNANNAPAGDSLTRFAARPPPGTRASRRPPTPGRPLAPRVASEPIAEIAARQRPHAPVLAEQQDLERFAHLAGQQERLQRRERLR